MNDGETQHESDAESRVDVTERSDPSAIGKTEARKTEWRHEMLTWSVPLVIGFYLSAFYVVRTIGFVKGDLTGALFCSK